MIIVSSAMRSGSLVMLLGLANSSRLHRGKQGQNCWETFQQHRSFNMQRSEELVTTMRM